MARKTTTVTKRGGLRAGSDQSRRSAGKAFSSDTRLKISNQDGANLFVIFHPDYLPVVEHYTPGSDDKKMHNWCGVHLEGDHDKTFSAFKYGAPDVCAVCAELDPLRKKAYDEKNERLKKAYRDMCASGSVLLIGAPCDYEKRRLRTGGKSNRNTKLIPYVDDYTDQIIAISGAAFQRYLAAWEENNIDGDEVYKKGIVVNFHRGVPDTGGFNQVLYVEFYPDVRIDPKKFPKLPVEIDFSAYGTFGEADENKLDEAARILRSEMPAILSNRTSRSASSARSTNKKASKKKAARKVSARRR